MRTTIFNLGARPTVVVEFVDSNGDPADPTAVTFQLKPPTGELVTSSSGVTNPVVGRYEWVVPSSLNVHGKWAVRAVGTGAVEAVDEQIFKIRESAVVAG